MSTPSPAGDESPAPSHDHSLNEVHLVGRVSADPEQRELPSGDTVVTLRVVVDRPPGKPPKGSTGEVRRQVDVIDVACWTSRTRRSALALAADDVARVDGALRRRFFPTATGRASRYEVEAARIVRVSRPARARAAS
jgi:single-strand DNA-binding protein